MVLSNPLHRYLVKYGPGGVIFLTHIKCIYVLGLSLLFWICNSIHFNMTVYILSVKRNEPPKINAYTFIIYHETKFVSKVRFTFRTILRTVSMLIKLKRYASLSIITNLTNMTFLAVGLTDCLRLIVQVFAQQG